MKPRQDLGTNLTFNVLYCVLALGWVWLIAVLAIEWGENLQRLTLRLEEANLLSSTFCNSTRGARLAKKYALCDEAEVMVKSKNLAFKAFEKTIRNVAMQAINATGEVSLAALSNVAAVALAAAAVGMLCNSLTRMINGGRAEIDAMSPMAQARLNACVNIRGDVLHLE
jgi:hypothetical protein